MLVRLARFHIFPELFFIPLYTEGEKASQSGIHSRCEDVFWLLGEKKDDICSTATARGEKGTLIRDGRLKGKKEREAGPFVDWIIFHPLVLWYVC